MSLSKALDPLATLIAKAPSDNSGVTTRSVSTIQTVLKSYSVDSSHMQNAECLAQFSKSSLINTIKFLDIVKSGKRVSTNKLIMKTGKRIVNIMSEIVSDRLRAYHKNVCNICTQIYIPVLQETTNEALCCISCGIERHKCASINLPSYHQWICKTCADLISPLYSEFLMESEERDFHTPISKEMEVRLERNSDMSKSYVSPDSPLLAPGEQMMSTPDLANHVTFPPLRPVKGNLTSHPLSPTRSPLSSRRSTKENLISHQLSPTRSPVSSPPKDTVLFQSTLSESSQVLTQSVSLQENKTTPANNQGLVSQPQSLDISALQTESSEIEPLQNAADETILPAPPHENSNPTHISTTPPSPPAPSQDIHPPASPNHPERGQISNHQKNPKVGPRKICRYLEKGICWFGAWGLEGGRCRNFHPEPCLRFLDHGEVLPKGCVKGVNCKYYHLPFFCENSCKYLWCDTKNCKFFHHMSCSNYKPDSPPSYPQTSPPSLTPPSTSAAPRPSSMKSPSSSPPLPSSPQSSPHSFPQQPPIPTPTQQYSQNSTYSPPPMSRPQNFIPFIPNFYPPPMMLPFHPPAIPPYQSTHTKQMPSPPPPPKLATVLPQQQHTQQMSTPSHLVSMLEDFILKMKTASYN